MANKTSKDPFKTIYNIFEIKAKINIKVIKANNQKLWPNYYKRKVKENNYNLTFIVSIIFL